MVGITEFDPADFPNTRDQEGITFRTLVLFLIGNREAIFQLTASRQTVWLGLLFVISAGFAREYDGEDLLHEPWHLLLPLAASLVTSFLLFGLVCLLAIRRGATLGTFFGAYRSFLGLYWMTAPLAWLYAIPVERFLTAGQAVETNIWLLGIVSLWRVILIIRVIMVLFQARFETVLPVVMLFADSMILFLLTAFPKPFPFLQVMGGVRLTESEMSIAVATLLVTLVATLTYPVWVLSTVVVFFFRQPQWSFATSALPHSKAIDRSVWLVAAMSILGWSLVLPSTQREQQLRRRVESELHAGHLDEAITIMSAHRIDEFPPHWDPPPHPGFRDQSLRVVDLVERVADRPDDWSREIFIEKFRRQLSGHHFWSSGLSQMDPDEQLKVLATIDRLSNRDELLVGDPRSNRYPLTEEDRARDLSSLLESLIADKSTDPGRDGTSRVSEQARDKAKTLLRDWLGPKLKQLERKSTKETK